MNSLKTLHTFGFDSTANEIRVVNRTDELKPLMSELENHDYCIIGDGSNTVFVEDFEGTVILNRLTGIEVTEDQNHFFIAVASGENWHSLVEYCLFNGMYGLENLALIPGTMGAAPIQNIGAYGVELEEFIESVEYFDIATKQFCSIQGNQCKFAYRDSIFKSGDLGAFFITKVNLKLNKQYSPTTKYKPLDSLVDPTAKDVFEAVIATRRQKLPDPQRLGNAGSFFKNPVITCKTFDAIKVEYPDCPHFMVCEGFVKVPAAWLIDQAGFKGTSVRGITCYQNQPLVLVNLGSGTGQDLLTMARNIQQGVFNRFAIKLENEVRLMGQRKMISL